MRCGKCHQTANLGSPGGMCVPLHGFDGGPLARSRPRGAKKWLTVIVWLSIAQR